MYLTFKRINGFWTLNGKKYSGCTPEEKNFFNQLLIKIKQKNGSNKRLIHSDTR